MIESVKIADIASYGAGGESLVDLSKFNFIYGSNGSGKTTITRVIADEGLFPSCKVTWKGATKLQALVYNRDFVDKNFNQAPELKGVFTLGAKHVDALNKIATAKVELDVLTKKIENLTQGLQGDDGTGGKQGELAALEIGLKEKCWGQKQKHDAKLQGAFEGYRGSAEKFKAKVLQEDATNSASLLTLAELEKKAETVFGPTPHAESSISAIEMSRLLAHESDPVLKKRIIGKEDVDIASMIKKLENSDWVREGRHFYEANDSICPFCQQSTTAAFAKSLTEYFDETFEKDSKRIDTLSENYKAECDRLRQQIASMIAAPSRFLDLDKLKAEAERFDSLATINFQYLSAKRKEPSQAVTLESTEHVFTAIKSLVDTANALISEHNTMVANLAQERSTLTAQVWKHVLQRELKADLIAYDSARLNLDKAIAGMTAQKETAMRDLARKEKEIRALEKETTSVQPTIDGINELLVSFGFQGFSLARAGEGTSYKLVRPDGRDAKDTLSEGERTFVTFLYFYHLLKGSDSESGMTADRVVVFDDPVSSLDSDILFIVGSLIKGLFDEVRRDAGHIKQLFVLTHNVYFHKEVTFNPHRRDVAMNEETFFVVRKPGLTTKVEKHASNPIKTSYELLWAEVRRADRSNLTIQNTLRRILENYFKILGAIDPDTLCGMFEGRERLICKSLLSWVNDGSHYAHDDLYISIDDSVVDVYLGVFRSIFEKSRHLAHYKMMMGDAYVDAPAPETGGLEINIEDIANPRQQMATTVLTKPVGEAK